MNLTRENDRLETKVGGGGDRGTGGGTGGGQGDRGTGAGQGTGGWGNRWGTGGWDSRGRGDRGAGEGDSLIPVEVEEGWARGEKGTFRMKHDKLAWH